MNPSRLSHLFALTVLSCASANAATLVNEWKFEGNADDTSPSGNHGTATGSPTYIAGKFGQAISLPAGAKVQNITAEGLPVAAADAWSTNVWVSLTAAPVSLAYLCGFGTFDAPVALDGSSRGLIAFGNPSNRGIYFWGYSRDFASNTAYPLNQWAMITITRSGNTQTIYPAPSTNNTDNEPP